MGVLMKGYLSATVAHVGSIKQALNRSGWLADEVIAAGDLRQGKPMSMAGMVTGTALFELARRRSKTLPRHFVLALTATEVVAFRAFGTGDDSDAEAEPYTVRIEPGTCATWPRASVRLTDLRDGPQSEGCTLELPTEQVPVMRMARDQNTDELMYLLSGGARPTGSGSEKHRRSVENRESLRRANALEPADVAQAAADAARGCPDFGLTEWAGRRGLTYRGSVAQAGHFSVTCPWSEGLLFNVVRGHWPGGTYGVLCHEARIYEDGARGYFYGGRAEAAGSGKVGTLVDVVDALTLNSIPLPLGGHGQRYFKVPYTVAGTRVPHLGSVTGVHVARRAERYTAEDNLFGIWHSRELTDLGLEEPWVAAVRTHSDEAVVERLVRGPIRDLLAAPQGLGFEIRIEYGQVTLSRQGFIKEDAELDALVEAVETLARTVREICVPDGPPADLDRRLEPPEWLEPVRRKPKDKHTLWPIGALVERVVQVADARGLAVEAPRAFHRAFPSLNVPGEAFGVLHGTLPGTRLSGRMLCCAERPMYIPDEIRKLLKDPGGSAGCDVAVLAVRADAAATAPEGELEGDVRVVIADGILTAWRPRRSWQADGAALDKLAADVAAIVERRALRV